MARGPAIDWNDCRNAQLAELWASGLKIKAIARRLGLQEGATYQHARRVLNLPQRKASPRRFYQPPARFRRSA